MHQNFVFSFGGCGYFSKILLLWWTLWRVFVVWPSFSFERWGYSVKNLSTHANLKFWFCHVFFSLSDFAEVFSWRKADLWAWCSIPLCHACANHIPSSTILYICCTSARGWVPWSLWNCNHGGSSGSYFYCKKIFLLLKLSVLKYIACVLNKEKAVDSMEQFIISYKAWLILYGC